MIKTVARAWVIRLFVIAFIVLGWAGTARAGITISVKTTNTTCGYDNGVIIASAAGGTAPYVYTLYNFNSWFSESGVFSSLAAGTYALTVYDSTGATATMNVTLTNIFSKPFVTTETAGPTSCNTNDGSITVKAANGSPPYAFSIDDGQHYQTSNVFNNLSPGTYSIWVKDANGCVVSPWTPVNASYLSYQYYTDALSFGTYLSAHCPITLPMQYPIPTCGNLSYLAFYSAQGGTAPYTYGLDAPNYAPLTQDGYYFIPPGRHTVYIKDSTGLETSVSVDVLSNCFNVDTKVSTCGQNNGQVAVTSCYAIHPLTYSIDGTNFQTDSVFTGLKPGSYNIIVKDVNGAMLTATAQVETTCPEVTAVAAAATCGQSDGSITATGSKGTPPYQYSLDGTSFQNSRVFNGLAAGTYTVTVRDAAGAFASTKVVVKDNCLAVKLQATPATCGNTNGTIAATGSNGQAPYQFSTDGFSFGQDNIFKDLPPATYTIAMRDADGLTASATITVLDEPSPTIKAVPQLTDCSGKGGGIDIQHTGGTAPFTYSLGNGQNPQPGSLFNGLDSGRYIANISDSNGCAASQLVRVPAPPTPVFSLGRDTSLCTGQVLVLVAPLVQGYIYRWPDQSTGNSYTAIKTGSYMLKVTNQYNCSATDAITVNFNPPPIFDLGADTTLCSGKVLPLQLSLPGAIYRWNTGSSASSLTINSAGKYWLTATQNGCAASDTLNVGYTPSPIVALGNDTTLCAGKTLLLDATNAGASYTWQDGTATPTYTVTDQGTYSVAATANGCTTNGQVNVAYETPPLINIGKDTALCSFEKLVLNAAYAGATYLWQDGSTLPEFNVGQPGTYSVTATNACGVATASVIVQYKDCACQFYIPTAFTPNNDRQNDIFKPSYRCLFSQYRLSVFNRFGQQVYTTANAGEGWNGTLGGVLQPVGAYIWMMEYFDTLAGKVIKKKGTVVLIR